MLNRDPNRGSWASSNTGFEGKWKEATQGSRMGTPNVDAEAELSLQRGPPKNSHAQASLPRLPYNAQFQQSRIQLQLQPLPQSQKGRSVLRKQRPSTVYVKVMPKSDEKYDHDCISPMQDGGGSGKGKGVLRGEKGAKLMKRRL